MRRLTRPMSKTVKGPTPGARCSYVQSGGNSAKGLDQDIPPVCCRPFEAQPVGAFIVGCCYYLCTTTRLAADYSRQQVMEVVVIGLELPLGSLKAHIRERSWVCRLCVVTTAGSIHHSIRSDRRSHHSYHKLFNPRLTSQKTAIDG